MATYKLWIKEREMSAEAQCGDQCYFLQTLDGNPSEAKFKVTLSSTTFTDGNTNDITWYEPYPNPLPWPSYPYTPYPYYPYFPVYPTLIYGGPNEKVMEDLLKTNKELLAANKEMAAKIGELTAEIRTIRILLDKKKK